MHGHMNVKRHHVGEVSTSYIILHTPGSTSLGTDQLVAESATYTIHNKHKHAAAELEPAN